MKTVIYKTDITNPKTGKTLVKFCQTDKGFSHAVSQAMESVVVNTPLREFPQSWNIQTKIVAYEK